MLHSSGRRVFLAGPMELAQVWNFGSVDDAVRPLRWIVERMMVHWGAEQGWEHLPSEQVREAQVLKCDSAKARAGMAEAITTFVRRGIAPAARPPAHASTP